MKRSNSIINLGLRRNRANEMATTDMFSGINRNPVRVVIDGGVSVSERVPNGREVILVVVRRRRERKRG